MCWGVLVQYPVCVFGLIINHCEALPRRDAPHLCAFSHLDTLLHLPSTFVKNDVEHGTSVWCLSSIRNAHELSKEGRQDFTVDWHCDVLLYDV